MTLNEAIGFQMRNQRLLKRLTIDDIAPKLGYASKNSVSLLELGKTQITVEILVNYCNVVGCDWRQVLDDAIAMTK